jgi:hypothetical protein
MFHPITSILMITNTVNPLYNHTLSGHFYFVTLMNYDLNMYHHIPYKLLQDYDYRKKKLTKQLFYARINVLIV